MRGCCLRNRTLFCAGKDGSIMVNDKARRSVIQFEDVSFEYPGAETESIHHISLDIKKGEFLVLTGGSGCGKTTLTRLINGLAEQFYEGTLKGRVTLLGRSISEYPLYEIGKKVGSIFQDPKSQFLPVLQRMKLRSGVKTMAFRMKNWMDGFQVRSNVLTEICYAGKKFIRCPAEKNRK